MRSRTQSFSAHSIAQSPMPIVLCTVLLATVALDGCAFSSGVQHYGGNTYRVEASSEFGLAEARARAFADAREYCSDSGDIVFELSSSTDSYPDPSGYTTHQIFELLFVCAGTTESSDAVATSELSQ